MPRRKTTHRTLELSGKLSKSPWKVTPRPPFLSQKKKKSLAIHSRGGGGGSVESHGK